MCVLFQYVTFILFHMQRGLATRKLSISLSVRLSIRLSVCLSVKLVDYDKIKESSAQIFIPHERSFVPVF